jgi:hypothetical protein
MDSVARLIVRRRRPLKAPPLQTGAGYKCLTSPAIARWGGARLLVTKRVAAFAQATALAMGAEPILPACSPGTSSSLPRRIPFRRRSAARSGGARASSRVPRGAAIPAERCPPCRAANSATRDFPRAVARILPRARGRICHEMPWRGGPSIAGMISFALPVYCWQNCPRNYMERFALAKIKSPYWRAAVWATAIAGLPCLILAGHLAIIRLRPGRTITRVFSPRWKWSGSCLWPPEHWSRIYWR